MAAIIPLGSRPYPIGLAKVPGSASDAGVVPQLLNGVPGIGARLSSPSGVPSMGVGPSSSS
jgi:hypothetical protein